jgi:hypothetical protein
MDKRLCRGSMALRSSIGLLASSAAEELEQGLLDCLKHYRKQKRYEVCVKRL